MPSSASPSIATKRLFLGQTAIDFWGHRRTFFGVSLLLIVISVLSLSLRDLNLGIDFEGGVAFDVPAGEISVDDARSVLDAHGIDGNHAKIEERASTQGDILKVQIEEQADEVRVSLQEAFADVAGVEAADVSVAAVSSSWGEQITRKAVIALLVFLLLFAIVIAIRFEWRMAVAAIVAMLHDVVIAAGIYSVFGFAVTPPTVIAFLTILGYSLYDTIVVFDRVKENERRITRRRARWRRPRQHLHEPGADALAEHVRVGVAPGAVAAGRRRRPARSGDAAGVRPRPVHRHAHRAPTRRSSSPRRCSACSSGPGAREATTSSARTCARSSCAVSASSPRYRVGGVPGAP